jgi:hypothetical protein
MKDKETQLIWENYQNRSDQSADPQSRVINLFNDLLAQKQEHYPEADVSDLYDAAVEDLESEFNEQGDEQSLYILQQLHSTGELQPKQESQQPDTDLTDIIYHVDLYNGNSQVLLMTPEIQEALDHYEAEGNKKVGGATVWMGEEEMFLKPNKHG